MEFNLLGPLEVVDDGGRTVALGSGRQLLLAHCLLLQRNDVVSRDRLIDALWGERPPATAANALQVQVHSLRKRLGPERIVTEHSGYRLRVDRGELDLERFEQLAASGRSALATGDAETAALRLREAVALWRGPALADVTYEPFAQPEIARLEELRLVALEQRVEADLALARHSELVPELEALVAEHPERERSYTQLMLALYRSGRQADALEVFGRARRALREELGLEPGPELRDLQQAILRQDASLGVEAPEVRTRRHLPAPATALVGRRTELAEIGRLLRDEGVRLATLTGPGGIGKTRLALQVAHDLAEDYRDGVYFVDLAPLADPRAVPQAIATALGIERHEEELASALAAFVGARRVLLLIDNFEQVQDAAPLLGELIRAAAGLSVLVTSRTALRLSCEREYRVPPLPLGDAVAMFVIRARAVAPSFRLAGEEADEVAELCERVDRLPLAIELTAARTRDYHPAELLALAPRSLELATDGARDLPARQRTLRATIEWSYRLLPEEAQASFARLGIFVGGCTVEAATAVCETGRAGLASLAGQSLLHERYTGGELRFSMLETVREFARERLSARGELDEYARRHAGFYVRLAEAAELELDSAGEEQAWAQLDAELHNLRAALSWSHAAGGAELELRLATALAHYWWVRNHLREGLAAIERAVARAGDAPALLRGKALFGAARLAHSLGDHEVMRRLAEESLAAYRSAGDRHGEAQALLGLGIAAGCLGDRGRSRALYERCAGLYRELGDQRGLAAVLNNTAYRLLEDGETERARELCHETLAILERLGLRARTTVALGNLGLAALLELDLGGALDCFVRAVEIAADIGYAEGSIYGLEGIGAALAATGRNEQ
ncbi:MAG: winged helix-turn-helix domain-containing protein, partial [Thermoleophilia bacterium]|nr:winged helix-turn-helix domain-containing protein [Thermoleophilia bacterium]